jgi:hypothetical protein
VFFFDLFDRVQDDLRVARVNSTVVIQIRHPAGAIVDVDICCVAVHVPAQLRASANSAAVSIVPGRSESAHHDHTLDANPVLL